MKVFCISNNVSSLLVNSFVDKWREVNDSAFFQLCDLTQVKLEVMNKKGLSVRYLSCDQFCAHVNSLADSNNVGNTVYKSRCVEDNTENYKNDDHKNTFDLKVPVTCQDTNSSCCKNNAHEEFIYNNDDFIFWLDQNLLDNKSCTDLSHPDGNIASNTVFKDGDCVEQYVNTCGSQIDFLKNWLENSKIFLQSIDIDIALEKLYEKMKYLPKRSVGVYSDPISLVDDNSFSFINNFSGSAISNFTKSGENKVVSDKVSLCSSESTMLVNNVQRRFGNTKAAVLSGSGTPVGFLLACLGFPLVSEFQFLFSYCKMRENIAESDLIILFEDDVNLLNVDNGLLSVLKSSIYEYAKPFLLISKNLDLSQLELNEFFVSSAYTYDCNVEEIEKLSFNLANTWKI